jgi:hypothetical protein
MKQLVLSISTAALLMVGTACQKNTTAAPADVNETIEVALSKNQSYTYTLPESATGDAFAVASQNANGSTSLVETTSSQASFKYSPAPDFVGTDVVVVSTNNSSTPPPSCGTQAHHPQGGCGTPPPPKDKCGNGHSGDKKHRHHEHGSCDKPKHAAHTITFQIKVTEPTQTN